MSENSLRVRGTDQFIVELERDSAGSVSRIITVYDDGRKEPADRSR
jgi:hypothetical protein